MTPVEKEITSRLQTLSGKFATVKEGKFVDQLKTWESRPMTDAGRAYLLRLLDRYADQIPDAADLKEMHVQEQLDEL